MIRTAAATLAFAVLVLGAVACGGTASRVQRVALVNQTEYDLDVDVTGAARDGWLGLGHVRRGGSTEVADVVDQGARWIFRFQHAGTDAGELVVGRSSLVTAKWRVEIPGSVGDRLRQLGVAASTEGG